MFVLKIFIYHMVAKYNKNSTGIIKRNKKYDGNALFSWEVF